MASAIDVTVPVTGNPTTQSVRDNFTTAANEITALQGATAGSPFLSLAGGTMTGAIYLAGDPTDSMMPATKGYVDASGGGGGGGGIPEAPADSNSYGRRNGAWVQVVNLGGGTMTGLLTLSGDPTANLHAATKQYSDRKLPLAGGTLTGPLVLAADPAAPLQAATKEYADNLPFLPLAGGTMTGPLALAADPAAPLQSATKQYVDNGDAVTGTIAAMNVGRNLLHNPMFRVQQRGTGPFSTAGYTADGWTAAVGTGGGTRAINVSNIGDPGRTAIGDEEAAFTLSYQFTGGSAAGDFDLIMQKIEGVRRTANKTITVSFWATSPTSQKLGVNVAQVFGTGGSPSTAQYALATGAAVQLTATWVRYQVPIAMPSIAGKTLGTALNSDLTQVAFFMSAGASNATIAGIGVQSGQVLMWGVQVEVGGVATPLEKPDPQQDLAKCQRYYVGGAQCVIQGYGVATGGGGQTYSLPVQMRAAAVITPGTSSNTNVGTVTLTPVGTGGTLAVWLNAPITATGSWAINQAFTASAEL